MKNFLFISFYFFLFLGLFSSCEKEKSLANSDEIFTPNLLEEHFNGEFFEFENEEELMVYSKLVDQMTDDEFLEFENKIGNKSIYGDYLRILEAYGHVQTKEELEKFFKNNAEKVEFVFVEEGFTDLQPLLSRSPQFVKKLVNETGFIKIGKTLNYYSEGAQFSFKEDLKEEFLRKIKNGNIDDLEELGISKFDLNYGGSVNSRMGPECNNEQKPKPNWYTTCANVRVRGRMNLGETPTCNGSCVFLQYVFETKSFYYHPFIFAWLPTKANNRLSYDLTSVVVTTELGSSGTFSATLPTITAQNSYKVGALQDLGFNFPLGPSGTYSVADVGTTTHNLTKFNGNCHYDITCGLSF